MSANDGGPAMTMRDKFAAQAIIGVLRAECFASEAVTMKGLTHKKLCKMAAEFAYMIADEMIKARK